MNIDWLKRSDYPPSMRKLLKRNGKEIVTGIVVVRTPLTTWSNLLLNIASFGEFEKVKKQNKYDDYFHLHVNIETNKSSFILEKNHTLNFKTGAIIYQNSEVLKVDNIPPFLTISELIENTKNKQGSKFFNYKASNNNCQVFLRDVLLSNNINNTKYIDFILQDTQSIFKNQSLFRKIVNTATDIGSVADHLILGSGIHDFDTLLTNIDLEDITLLMNIPLIAVVSKDKLKGKLKNGRYILNLEDSHQGGSHWVAFVKEDNNIFYFDSFAGYPVQPLVDVCTKNKYHIEFNITQIQDMSSILCGWYCVAFFKYLEINKNNNSTLKNCSDFVDMFKHDTKKNDQILIKFIKR